MATRLSYALPIARELARSAADRARGGLARRLPAYREGSPFVIVTGPGRSGTSAVARVIHESGLSIGETFDDPSDDNAAGFYEDVAMRDVNHRILGDVGLPAMRRSPSWPWRSAVLAVARRYADEQRALADAAAGGWKDPLFCKTLESWLPHLPRRPRIVVCLRSPEAFLHSVSRIYGLVDRAQIEGWWAHDLRRLLDVIEDYELDATCLEYDVLVRRPEETVARLAAFLGHELDAGFVEPELRRFDFAVPSSLRPLYDRVRRLAPDGAAPPAVDVDAYLGRVREADRAFAVARDLWRTAVAPEPSFEGEAIETTRAAAAAYVQALQEAQRALGAIEPPKAFARYHELSREAVNNQRLVAQLTLRAAEKRSDQAIADARMTWRRFADGAALDRERAAAYERALRDAKIAAG